jgi:hypothetical protein
MSETIFIKVSVNKYKLTGLRLMLPLESSSPVTQRLSSLVSKWMLLSKPETLQKTGDAARHPAQLAGQWRHIWIKSGQ